MPPPSSRPPTAPAQQAAATAATAKPRLSRAAFLRLLREVTAEAEASVRALEEAVRQAGSREAAAAARAGVPHLLRHDLARATAAAEARAGATPADVDAALAYWRGAGAGAGADADDDGADEEASAGRGEVAEAVATLKARVGKHLLTRRSVIAAIEAAHEAQAAAAPPMVAGALQMCGGDPQGAEFQMALQHLSQRVANEACLADAGVGLQELMAFATREVAVDDAFRRAFESVVETCGGKVQMALNAALMAVLSGGGGGMEGGGE